MWCSWSKILYEYVELLHLYCTFQKGEESVNMQVNDNALRNQLIERLVDELPVLRARLGVSQADIAEKIGISRQTYNGIETGKKKMNWTMFVALIAVFRSNDQTRLMLKGIDGFEDELVKVMEL